MVLLLCTLIASNSDMSRYSHLPEMQHCEAGYTLLGHAPVWLSCIILFFLGAVFGAAGGVLGLLHRQKKLRRQAYLSQDRVYDEAAQPIGISSEVCMHTKCLIYVTTDIDAAGYTEVSSIACLLHISNAAAALAFTMPELQVPEVSTTTDDDSI